MKNLFKKICIASDHAGFKMKESIKDFLINKNISIIDLGPMNENSVDYPDFAKKVSNRVKLKKSEAGILICGSGIGMNMAANRHKNIRAALCYNTKTSKLSRMHNDANVISIGARLTKKNVALRCVNTFIKTNFIGGRHLRRINKI